MTTQPTTVITVSRTPPSVHATAATYVTTTTAMGEHRHTMRSTRRRYDDNVTIAGTHTVLVEAGDTAYFIARMADGHR